MSRVGNLAALLLGGAALGAMMSTVPDYNSSFRPFFVSANKAGIGEGRGFSARLLGLKTADVIAYTRFGQPMSYDTSAIFLVAEVSITGRSESRQLEAVWFGATGRQYRPSARLEDVPHGLSSASFEPGLEDRAVAVFELPQDEIIGGQLGLAPRGAGPGDRIVRFSGPETMPSKQAILRLAP